MKRILATMLVLAGVLSSCTGKKQESKEVDILRVGVMPSVDHLPLAVANEQHYFDSLGLQVELVTFASPMDRDAALQAGELDATISDYTTVMMQNAKGLPVQLFSATDGIFALIANPNAGIKTIADLKGKKVALSSNTVIEYATDKILEEAQLSPADVEKVEVQKIPLRLEMLAKGEVDAAVLPQPFAQIAINRGLLAVPNVLGVGDKQMHITGIAVDSKRLAGKEAVLAKLIEGYNRATSYLNDKEIAEWAPIAAKILKVEEPVVAHMSFGYFSPITTPATSEIESVAKWLQAKGLIPAEYQAATAVMPLPSK